MNQHRSLEQHLRQFELSPTADLGGVVWKHDDGLQMGIIVGKDVFGEKYVICNQNSLKNFALQSLKEFENGKYCYLDFNRQFHHRHQTVLLAFDFLYQYNQYNNQRYSNDFKLELPTHANIEPNTPAIKEFSKGLGSVVYRASLLHILEAKMKTDISTHNTMLRKSLSSFAYQFKQSITAPFFSLKIDKT